MNVASNRLPVLLVQVREMHKAVGQFEGEAARAALGAGAMLAEAKGLCRHGEWLPFLEAAGIPARSASRYMALHKAGLISATVAEMGLAEAERLAIAGFKLLPPADKAVVGFGGRDTTASAFWYLWRVDDNVAGLWFVDLADDRFYTRSRPMFAWFAAYLLERFAEPFTWQRHSEVPIQESIDFRKKFDSLETLWPEGLPA